MDIRSTRFNWKGDGMVIDPRTEDEQREVANLIGTIEDLFDMIPVPQQQHPHSKAIVDRACDTANRLSWQRAQRAREVKWLLGQIDAQKQIEFLAKFRPTVRGDG